MLINWGHGSCWVVDQCVLFPISSSFSILFRKAIWSQAVTNHGVARGGNLEPCGICNGEVKFVKNKSDGITCAFCQVNWHYWCVNELLVPRLQTMQRAGGGFLRAGSITMPRYFHAEGNDNTIVCPMCQLLQTHIDGEELEF